MAGAQWGCLRVAPPDLIQGRFPKTVVARRAELGHDRTALLAFHRRQVWLMTGQRFGKNANAREANGTVRPKQSTS